VTKDGILSRVRSTGRSLLPGLDGQARAYRMARRPEGNDDGNCNAWARRFYERHGVCRRGDDSGDDEEKEPDVSYE
jgi:hypothetical protein